MPVFITLSRTVRTRRVFRGESADAFCPVAGSARAAPCTERPGCRTAPHRTTPRWAGPGRDGMGRVWGEAGGSQPPRDVGRAEARGSEGSLVRGLRRSAALARLGAASAVGTACWTGPPGCGPGLEGGTELPESGVPGRRAPRAEGSGGCRAVTSLTAGCCRRAGAGHGPAGLCAAPC